MKRLGLIVTLLMLFHPTAFAMGPEHTGSWFNANENGHGFSIEYGDAGNGTPLAVVYWYVYDKDGAPVFLTGSGHPDETGVDITFYAHYGMGFGVFDPSTRQERDGGVARFTFQDDTNGTFEYFPSTWTIQNFGHLHHQMSITKLFGVTHPNEPPTGEPVPVPGTWSGRMIYNRGSAAGGACYDADVQISTFLRGNGDGHWVRINTVSSDAGGLQISGDETLASDNWQAVGSFYMYSNLTDFTLIFNAYGYAEGVWAYDNSDCYGEWTFTKD